jgi:hypothetical protein
VNCVPNRITRPSHHIAKSIPGIACLTISLFLVLFAPLLSSQVPEHKFRSLSGTIESPQHEPLRGAVVQLQQGDSVQIKSYVTTEDGHYHFNRLNSEDDYKVWVIFRNRHSKPKEISKFDDHLDKVIDFTIETF